MALTDFFRINLPYGMKRNSKNEWIVFNREYMPLGWNNTDAKTSNRSEDWFDEYPIYTKYKRLTDTAIEKMNPSAIQRNDAGEISFVFFYNDGTNPASAPRYWEDYFKIIKALSKFEIAR